MTTPIGKANKRKLAKEISNAEGPS